jgi:hypothetical protein
MEEKCVNCNVNFFFKNVESRFDSFKKKIEKLSQKQGIVFDEDIFMDTIVKCMTTFSNGNANDNDVDYYFWVAYKQNIISFHTRNKFKNTLNFDDIEGDIVDTDYNSDIDEIVSLIKDEIKKDFGEKTLSAWILHVCSGYTYNELKECGYDDLNLHNEFRQIKRHILQKYITKNLKLKQLLIENNFI